MLTLTAERRRVEKLLSGFGPEIGESLHKKDSSDSAPANSLTALLGNRDRKRRSVRFRIIIILALILIGSALSLWVLIIAPLYVGIESLLLKRGEFKRCEEFERDYPAMLLSLASGVRTGLDPLSALFRVQESLPAASLVREELSRVKADLELGKTEREAIKCFGASVSHPDIRLFRTAFILAREQGASLAHCLHRLTKVTRARQSFRRKTRAAIAMQRLSSIGILICSVIISSFQVIGNRKAFIEAAHHPLGFWLMLCGGSLIGVGMIWMLRIGRNRI